MSGTDQPHVGADGTTENLLSADLFLRNSTVNSDATGGGPNEDWKDDDEAEDGKGNGHAPSAAPTREIASGHGTNHMEQQSTPRSPLSKYGPLAVVIILIVVVVAVVVGVVVGGSGGGGSTTSSTNGSSPSAPVSTPTLAPATSPSSTNGSSPNVPVSTPTLAPATSLNSVADVVSADGNFTSLVAALTAAGLVQALGEPNGPFTVFAPVDAALSELNQTYLTMLLQDPEWNLHLQNLLLFHVATGEFSSKNLSNGERLPMLNGDGITVLVGASSISLKSEYDTNYSIVTMPDLLGSNGVVHQVDHVLLPFFFSHDLYKAAAVAQADDGTKYFSKIVSLIDLAGLSSMLKNDILTFFAPLDSAIPDNLMNYLQNSTSRVSDIKTLVLYHLVEGIYPLSRLVSGPLVTLEGSEIQFAGRRNITVNDAPVLGLDGLSSNGVAHAIGQVLIPPGVMPVTVTLAQQQDLSMLFGALETAGLLNILAVTGPYTILAPTNTALAAFAQATSNRYFSGPDWIVHLQTILLFHVTNATFTTANLTNGQELAMLSGEELAVATNAGSVTVSGIANGADLIANAEYISKNGVVHKINSVLKPEFLAYNLFEALMSQPELSIFANLTVEANLKDTLQNSILTLLVPINGAFDALPNGTLQVLRSNITNLAKVLQYHMIPQVYPFSRFVSEDLGTLEGQTLSVLKNGSSVSFPLYGVNIFPQDALASNGIGHAISGVLIPPDVTL